VCEHLQGGRLAAVFHTHIPETVLSLKERGHTFKVHYKECPLLTLKLLGHTGRAENRCQIPEVRYGDSFWHIKIKIFFKL
jgi:hypothetical protein